MTPATIDKMFARFAEQDPHPKTELYFINSYTLLVAVILSAQATDAGVNKVTKDLFQSIDTPQKMLTFGLEGLMRSIKTIGLYPSKAKNIIKMSQLLVDHYGGKIPETRTELESLPGVGRKTANVVLNVVFKPPTIPVDTHIFRVSNRLQLACGKNPLEVEKNLERVIPEKFRVHAHHWLVLHGRYVCKARKPLCPTCIINDLCPYEPKTK